MKRTGARCSSETARSRSRPFVTRVPASGGSRRTNFVSTPEKNRVAAATRYGSPEETGGQIRAKLTGMELTDNVHWRDLYQRNGTVMSTSMGRKRTGKWRVEQNQLCIEFEKEPIPTCYDVWISGKDVELRREGLLPLQGTLEPASGRN